jgi:two-component system cell cycle sensor histidine kinase/response regulator CckA
LASDPALAAKTLAEVEEASWRAAEANRGLLNLARRSTPDLKPLDLNRLVSHAVSMVRRLVEGQVEVKLELSPHAPLVDADPVQLEQVVLNLALNARDAMPGGGVLRITTVEESEGVLLRVADSGTGIRESVRGRLFEPFFTTKGGKGTGLGLAMVLSIVRTHGGSIDVQSELGKGTVFTIRLRRTTVGATRQARGSPHAAGSRMLTR